MVSLLTLCSVAWIVAQVTTEVPPWVTATSPVVVMGGVLWWFMGQARQDRKDLLEVTKTAVAANERSATAMDNMARLVERLERKLEESK